MKILVINAGSSSLKFTLFRMRNEAILAKGIVERIGSDGPFLKYEANGAECEQKALVANHSEALDLVCRTLVDKKIGVLESLEEVEAIGHRIVHGGEKLTASMLIDASVKDGIRECSSLAPLHNPPNLGGIEACEEELPGTPNVAVFDTAFHQSMPPASFLYAVPHELYEKDGIRKYGFHGTSHRFVTQATADFLQRSADELRLITCHLGNGCSIAAIDRGRVLDTSMGLTPLAGLVMGTRCGDIDPGVVIHMIKSGRTPEQVDKLLNKKSGLFGVANIGSSDMRDILEAIDEGKEYAKQALEMFVHRLVSYIGAYYTVLGGADAVVLTGGIGENSLPCRARVIDSLGVLGCSLDAEANERVGNQAGLISTEDSTLKALIMPTDEELMIARDTRAVVTASA